MQGDQGSGCRKVIVGKLRVAVILATLCLAPSWCYAAPQSRDYRGLYVMVYPAWTPQHASFQNALSKPFVDGATIIMQWMVLEPQPGVFDFSTLDPWIDFAVAHNKSISLGVMAGCYTPEWLYGPGFQVPTCSFKYNRSPQSTPHMMNLVLPLVWNSTYIDQYDRMIQAIGQHLRELDVPGAPKGAAYDALTMVKIDGINNTTEELRLYANMYPGGAAGPDRRSSAPPIWAAAGFTPRKVEGAWTALADNFATTFPDKILSMDIIQVNGFPAVDDSGSIYRPAPGETDRLTNEIIAIGLSHYKGRLAVQWNALSNRPPDPAVIDAGEHGAIVGWQLNEFLGIKGSGCFYGDQRAPCRSMDDFQKMLDNGIQTGGRFIEIWPADVDDFAAAFESAHSRLLN